MNRPSAGPEANGTWLTETFGLAVPVISAPMAGVADGRFAAAVCGAGALGMIGVGVEADAEWISRQCRTAAQAGGAYGVGLTAWIVDQRPDQLDAVLAVRPALTSVSFGETGRYLTVLREAGLRVATQVGTLAEAEAAAAAGVDVLVARGREAGGHGRDAVGTLTLLQELLEQLDVPVLAAGGIGTARGLAAVLAAGADGAWVGTAFLACPEATPRPQARERLLRAADTDTVYSRVFDVAQRLGWPQHNGSRTLRNRFYERWVDRLDALASDDAAAGEYTAARSAGDYDVAHLSAGQGVGLLRAEHSIAEVVASFARPVRRRGAPVDVAGQ